jgi:hypothetical protein
MAYDKTKMQDITLAEKSLWSQYVAYWNAGDIASAIAILNDNISLKYKVLNSFNWNRLINSVNDETDSTPATEDSLVGTWNADYGDLETASADFEYIGEWDSATAYKKNNLVKTDDYTTYFCIADNTNQTPPNATYWVIAQYGLDSVGIQVSATAPTNLRIGDMYLEEIIS